jgi:NAD(P)-dependent dehydrogenase (short-subunit alcohol dehydrogenase family)
MAEARSTRPAALLTGGSSGIGLAIARMLGAEGFALTLVARRAERLDDAVASMTRAGDDALGIVGDVADAGDISRIVQEHAARRGRLDVLVNSAGVGIRDRVDALSIEHLDGHWDVNVRAIALLYRAALDLLRATRRDGGHPLVVNIASVAGKVPQAQLLAYSATKAAVIALTAAMNRALSAEGIRSTALCPAYVDTPMADGVRDIPGFGEMLRPDDCAELVRALLRLSPVAVVSEMTVTRAGEVY